MAYILSTFTGLTYLRGHNDDDWIDRLHYQVTGNMLVCLSILVSFKQFGGRPIECMLPDHLPDSWEQYAENYCYAQDTYYLSYEQDLTRKDDMRNAHIAYYQWIPFYFIFSALWFQIPGLIWRFLGPCSGIRLESLIEHAVDPKNIQIEARQQATKSVAIYLENALNFQRRLFKRKMVPHKILRFLNLPYKPFFITMTYILTKFLYLINVAIQFVFMNFFLRSDSSSGVYGWTALIHVMNGTQWDKSGFFPRDTLCDLQVRVPGNVQQYSIQCVLSINLFTEKLFVFLWFWYHILAVITILSLLYWLCICTPPLLPRWFIVRQLELADMAFDPAASDQLVRKFVGHYLRTDGVFILHMIGLHTNAIFVSDLVAALYKSHIGIELLVQSVNSSFAKRWPSMEELQRMRSHITGTMIGEEIRHPPPIQSLNQPDAQKGYTGRSISEVVEKQALKVQTDEHELEEKEEAEESPYSIAATRKRHTQSSNE